LFRRQTRGDWLSDWAEPWEPADPDEVEESLETLCVRTRTPWDAYWYHSVRMDPGEHAAMRRKQVLQLARYGRMGSSPGDWDEVPVSEFRAWYQTLCDVLGDEHSTSRVMENQ
jgi:hypothetical protein